MSAITMQRDLVLTLKRETFLNVGILCKVQPMPSELSRQVFKENALDKPTQSFFNYLSYYLVSLVDSNVSANLPWPLYDTKSERAYRSELSNFINNYSGKGLLSPVISSYLVNPGCFKVTTLIYQLSQLAVLKSLSKKIKVHQKKLYDDMTNKYKSRDNYFLEDIERETAIMSSKFCNYLQKRKIMEEIAEKFRNKIIDMETKLTNVKAQKYIDNIIDEYVAIYKMDDVTKNEILQLKDVNKTSQILDAWLMDADKQITELEQKWDNKVLPLLTTCKEVMSNTETLIGRYTGAADRNTYMIEYNPKTDDMCTNELQNHVNSQQKYILKNIIKDERLNFPNLIRGFVIAICYIFKNMEIGDDIYAFNEYLESRQHNYSELVDGMKNVLESMMKAEAKLQTSPIVFNPSILLKEFDEVPPLPDLSNLKSNRDQFHVSFNSFTPLSMSKQFNLHRKTRFAKPQARSLLVTPFFQAPRDDFHKTLKSTNFSYYDRPSTSKNLHNLSLISQTYKASETIAECSSGFTKEQISRLLSTKKSSSSKKFKYKTERPSINVKKGGLFNESNGSNESMGGLYRSYSSPNLFENREKKPISRAGRRKLSIMQEDTPSLLELSGIVALDKDSNQSTPEGVLQMEKPRNLFDSPSLPAILVTKPKENVFSDFNIDLNKDYLIQDVGQVRDKVERIETPKSNTQLIKQTSSLEKIINRFKKVRANVLTTEKTDDHSDIKTIVEEKENFNPVNVFTANKILLPDLLSPSCSVISQKSTDYLDDTSIEMDKNEQRKPRQSLGAALGVDHTFLDQFDLID